ncbi:hypothetical protein MHYP_G00282000 [Metynnis hypsauchen]
MCTVRIFAHRTKEQQAMHAQADRREAFAFPAHIRRCSSFWSAEECGLRTAGWDGGGPPPTSGPLSCALLGLFEDTLNRATRY